MMNTQHATHRRTLTISSIIAIVIAILTLTGQAHAQDRGLEDEPRVWTEAACSGEAAIVYQERVGTGDGVTLSVFDDWGCAETLTQRQGLFLVEPWDGNDNRASFDKFNADAGCYVDTWSEAQTFAKRSGLENGSAWIVDSGFLEDPVVLHCADVNSSDGFGLNPNENQIDPDRIDWVTRRRAELIGNGGGTNNPSPGDPGGNGTPTDPEGNGNGDGPTDPGGNSPTDFVVGDCPSKSDGETLDETASREAARCVYVEVPSAPGGEDNNPSRGWWWWTLMILVVIALLGGSIYLARRASAAPAGRITYALYAGSAVLLIAAGLLAWMWFF